MAIFFMNIRYGKLEANKEEIIEDTKKVNAHAFIIALQNRISRKNFGEFLTWINGGFDLRDS